MKFRIQGKGKFRSEFGTQISQEVPQPGSYTLESNITAAEHMVVKETLESVPEDDQDLVGSDGISEPCRRRIRRRS